MKNISNRNIEKLRNELSTYTHQEFLNNFIINLEFTINYYFSTRKDKIYIHKIYGSITRLYSTYHSLIFNELLLLLSNEFEKQEFFSEEHKFENQSDIMKLPFLINEILKAFTKLNIERLWPFDENPPFRE